jgi:hypothetical protein
MALTFGSSFGFQSSTSSGGGGGGNPIAVLSKGVVLTTDATSFDFLGDYLVATSLGGAVSVSFNATSLLQKDGSVGLTANWNAGAYGITANTFTANNGFSFNVGLGGSLVSASTTESAKTWTLPNTTGTIALTSDIPSVSGFVKTDGTTPLTDDWNVGAFGVTANTFTANNLTANIGVLFNIGLGGSLVSASTTTTPKTWTLPNASGTIALKTDIPSFNDYIKADGTIPLTANWNVGAFGVTASTFTASTFTANSGFLFNVGLGGSLVSASITGSAKTWTLPNTTGTIALTSDIPSLSGYLKADGSIPLTSNWNVGSHEITANKFIGNNGFGFNIGLGGSLISASTTGSAKTWTLPDTTGTIALTSDIPSLSGYLKADGSIPLTANWNVGAYEITANKFIGNNGFGFSVGLGGSLVSASTTGSAKTWTLPNTTGTIALTSDIPSVSGFVKTDGTTELTANWNAGAYGITANTFTANNGFSFNVGLGGSLVSASTTGSAKTWTLPNTTGTIALTSDIPSLSGYLKADGSIPLTANWNVGAYEITANKFIGNNGFGFNIGLGGSLVSASTTGSAKTWTLPNETGTIALTSDLSGYLKADGSIPLTANWNVSAYEITANKFIGNNGFGFNIGLGGSLVSASTTGSAKTWTLPNTTGTIALTSDIPSVSGFLKADGSVPLTANWNVGAYEITANKFIGNNGFGFSVGLGGSLVSASTTGSAKTWTLPNTTGTIALTSDISSPIIVQDEGVNLTSALASLNFVGAGVSASAVGNDVTVTINGGGSGSVTSVGLTMPSAFGVSNSPITSSGDISVTALGLSSQYIRGDGQLANFPTSFGGGSSVNYYLNGGTSQGSFGGTTYYEMGTTADTGSAVDFTLDSTTPSIGFITDAGVPDQLLVPNGSWVLRTYLSQSNNTGQCTIQGLLYKYDGTNFTLLGTGTAESITNGTTADLYIYSIPIPSGTTLTRTDRLAVVLTAGNFGGGRTVTLYTQDDKLAQVQTTYATGLTALNGLIDQVQYFQVGSSGTSFNISSSGDTHTFNLPTASSTNSGALSNTDWTTFNNKGNGDLKADGSVPLTANWNVGAYEITANKFIGNNGFGFNVGLGGSLVSASTTGSAKTWTLPNTTGTIALTSDIPSVSGFVKTDGTTPLTADWNVGAFGVTANTFTANNGFSFNVGLGGSLVSASTTGSAKTWTLPNTTGTIALTSDIPSLSGYLKADGSIPLTSDWNVGAYEITANKFIGNNGFGFNVGLGGSLVSASTTGSAKTWTLPNTTGTIALTSDLSGYLKADGSIPLTANWNVGAYEITANTFIGNNGFGFNIGLGGSLVSASTTGSAKTWTLPNTTGTIALTSDIPSVSGFVKTDGTTELTANWNAGAYGITANTFTANNGFSFNVGLGGSLVSASTTGSAKTWTLPNTTGTIALTSDIPSVSGFLKADGSVPLTANWNVGAYEITANKFIGNNGFGFNVGLGGSLVSASTTGSAKTWTLPNITGTLALLNSPAFTGTPTVPSPSLSDNSSQIPNTAWINVKGFSRWFGIYNATTNTFTSPTESALPTSYNYGDFFTVSVAGVGNPIYGGAYYNVGDVWSYAKVGEDDVFILATSIQAGTLSAYSSTTGTIATTDSVVSAISKLNGNIGLKANIDSPAFTGTPTAPTPTTGDNSTKIATTEFVQNTVVAGSTSYGAIFSQATFNFLT